MKLLATLRAIGSFRRVLPSAIGAVTECRGSLWQTPTPHPILNGDIVFWTDDTETLFGPYFCLLCRLRWKQKPSLLGCPRKRRSFHVLLELSNDRRICWSRPGAASSTEQQWLEVHRSVRRDAAVVEKHRRRMGLEDRVASRLRFPPAAASPIYVAFIFAAIYVVAPVTHKG
jgi:hypothetical protein